MKKPSEAGAAEEPPAPAQGEHRSPTAPVERGGILGSLILHLGRSPSWASLEMRRGKESEEEKGGEGRGGERQGPLLQIHQGASEEEGKPGSPLPSGQGLQEATRCGGNTHPSAGTRVTSCPPAACPDSAVGAPSACWGSAGALHIPGTALWLKPSYGPGRNRDVAGDLRSLPWSGS